MGEHDVTAAEGTQDATLATLKVRGFDDRLPPALKFVELIARGGMASLVLVENAAGQRFACKLADVDDHDADAVLRFQREVELGKRFAHDGIVPVLAHDDARKLILFPFLGGGTLEQRLRKGPMATGEVKRVGRVLLRTLSALHAAGVVHRDVKPSNVLFDDDKTGARVVYLGDLGVARDQQASFTVTGMLIGTPAYMAPEQLRGRKADAKADVYGLGATLFEAATGRRFADVAVGADIANLVVGACGDAALARTIAAMVREDPDERPSANDALRLVDGGGARATFVAALPALFACAAIAAFVGVGVWAARSAKDVVAVLPVEGGALSQRSSVGVAQLVAVRLAESDAIVKGPLDLRAFVTDATNRASWLAAARHVGATHVVVGTATSADKEHVRLAFTLTTLSSGEPLWSSSDVVATTNALAAAGARADELAKRFTKPKKGADEALASASRALNQNNWSGALAALDRADALGAPVDDALYMRAISSWWADRPESETRAVIKRALDVVKTPEKRAMLDGLSLFLSARYDDAVAHFRQALVVKPSDRDLLYGLFEAEWHNGDTDAAIATYKDLVERYPDFSMAAYHVCMHALVTNDVDEQTWAFEHFRIDDEPSEIGWRARARLEHGDADGALALLLAATKERPDTDGAKEELGLTYAVLGEMELARAVVTTLQPHRDNLRLTLASVSGDDKTARVLLDDAERRIPADDGEALLYRAVDVASLETDAKKLDDVVDLAEKRLAQTLRESGKGRELLLLADAASPRGRAGPIAQTAHKEYAPLAKALIARNEKRFGDERDLVREAAKHSNGRLLGLERFLDAEASRALGDDAAVIEACNAGVIVPRGENPDWPVRVGPCELWSAEAALKLGHARDAKKYVDLLLAQRTNAPAHDALVDGALHVLAAIGPM